MVRISVPALNKWVVFLREGKEKRGDIFVPQPAFDSNVARLGIVACDPQPNGIFRVIGRVIPRQVGQLADLQTCAEH